MENVAKNTAKTTKAKAKKVEEQVTETVTETVKESKVTMNKLMKLIEARKFDEVIKLNPIDFMSKEEKSKLNLDTENAQIKGLLHLKDSNFKVDDSVLALALFFEISDVRLAIKKVIFETAKEQNKDGFYNMFEDLTEMESLALIKDGLTRVYNSVMKFKHRKQFIPKGKMMIIELNKVRYTINENVAKYVKYNLTDAKEIEELLLEHATPIDSDILVF